MRRWIWGTAALTGLVVGGVVMAGANRSNHSGRPPRGGRPGDRSAVRGTTRTARAAEVSRLGARIGTAAAANRARRIFASAPRRAALAAELELHTAQEVAATLGNMKGALMKIGQLASFVDDAMPEPVREALAQLQQDAPPMSPELAAEVVAAELGDRPERLFAEWDPTPLAAASIGQVHRAITHDDVAVAVKVQYPGVEEAIRTDLDGFDLALVPAPMLYPSFDPRSFAKEIRDRIGEELDYRMEADNQQHFADWYRGHPFIHIPDVVRPLSSQRVLTTHLATGARFDELAGWDQPERDLAAETIFRFVFRSLYRMGSFNGDPHPGNYLFRPGGQVTFLDFGLVKYFTEEDGQHMMDLARSVVLEPDLKAFRRAVEQAGYYTPNAPVTDQEMWDYSIPFWEMVRRDEPFRFTPEYASEVARLMLFGRSDHANAAKWVTMPSRWVIVQRINLGLIAILGRLDATANWRRIAEELWPETDGAPSTPLGQAEHEWWVRTGR